MTRAAPEVARLVAGEHSDPHHLLGAHVLHGRVAVRAYRPGADAMQVMCGGERVPMERIHPAGVFEAVLIADEVPAYRLRATYPGDASVEFDDPYRFWPSVGELDLHLLGEGKHLALWRVLGSHPRVHQEVAGTSFAVWAPNARSVRVVGDFNGWDGRVHPMRSLGASGIWEIFVPGVVPGTRYKYEIYTRQRHLLLKADPIAVRTEVPPADASVVWESNFEWSDTRWREAAVSTAWHQGAMSIYEVHLGSWRRIGDGDDSRPMTYRELAPVLAEYVADLGFTHVELLPPAEHPFGPSWGYQVTSYFAPTARFGSPDDFRFLVDTLHRLGIGVIVDWVPAHFPRDEWALARFDGTALYEHDDPRKGEHPDWGTLVFNYGRNEVRNFLIASALFWLQEMHVDGLRVDAVASMLYLDYSREHGEWIPNQFGGRENLEAISFLKQTNETVYGRVPGAITVAEESTAWPAVSRPTYLGGLGFGFKWNMGWMHDTLDYLSTDPLFRRFHHQDLTFGLLYAFHENFVLPLSHDEVVHGKGSLLAKMPGERFEQIANLRALFAWMWAHPGKKLLFMGGEIAQEREWSEATSLDWHVLEWAHHRGVQDLVREMNRVYREEPALWELDFVPEGFRWIEGNDVDNSVYSFLRYSTDRRRVLACVANFTPVRRVGYRIGLPTGGEWLTVLNTDDPRFMGNGGGDVAVRATDVPSHGLSHSASLDLPGLAVVWLRPREAK